MSFWISFLNDFAVSIFGSVLSASFCDALANRRNRRIFVCCTAYLAFLLYHSAREQTQIRLREVQKSLDIQLTQAVREINALRESQLLASRVMVSAYRVSVPLCSGTAVSAAFRYRTDSLSSGCLFELEQIVDSIHFLCDSVG